MGRIPRNSWRLKRAGLALAMALVMAAGGRLMAGEEAPPLPEKAAAPGSPPGEAKDAAKEAEPLVPEDDECLACHGSKDKTVERDGKQVSIYVDAEKLKASIHGAAQKPVACISCHASLAGKDLPHGKDVGRAACGSCHPGEEKLHASSLHGQALARGDQLAPRCQDCHGSHEIVKVRDRRSAVAPQRIPQVCGRCHQEGSPVQRRGEIPQHNILENYSESIHGQGLLKKGLTVTATCASCHTAHRILPHTDENSSIARKNIAATCTTCHAQIEEVHRKIIKGELWEKEANVLPACVDCHQPHKVRKVFYEQGMADRDCLTCHEKEGVKASGDGRSLRIDAAELAGSRHVKVACSQCHSQVNPAKERPCASITAKVDCGSCHVEMAEEYQTSVHGQLFGKGDTNAPSCRECHGTHGVLGKADPRSPSYPTNIPDLCARCHREGERAALRYTGKEHQITQRYAESIHGKGLLKSGLVVTAMCTSCHTAHRELPMSDPRSSVNPANLPATCGHCHNGIQEKFEKSIHSTLVTTTDKELPVCSSCHTAHTIRRADEAGFRLEIMNTCGRCHQEIAKTYFDTHHGKASLLAGGAKTAKCFDCHGAHDILPPGDPRSHLSRDHVVETCQKCHPGATRRFAGYLTHATHHDPKKYPLLFWTFWGMTSLLVMTFLFGGLHTLLWMPRSLRLRKTHPRIKANGEKQYVRFTRLNRTLHIVMIVSFISLALTGLTLKFSYTGWAQFLSRILGGFEGAGLIHRMAAVLMGCLFTTHLVDLVRRKRRDHSTWKKMLFGPNSMIPNWKDLSDLVGTVKWFLGKGERPAYGRWTYWEKFDYFAVFWGIAVIGSTGLMLWFSEAFTHVVPGWFLNVANIIHSDEALLAVGFIFTIHFFNTHLRPEKFPMDIVVFTGQMPLEELKRDKPLEYEAMVKSGELEKRMVEPYQPIVIRTIRFFAWIALAIGFTIVLWIIYAMIFAYR
jgi:cytochrome b subunit of formate dehydrogenase